MFRKMQMRAEIQGFPPEQCTECHTTLTCWLFCDDVIPVPSLSIITHTHLLYVKGSVHHTRPSSRSRRLWLCSQRLCCPLFVHSDSSVRSEQTRKFPLASMILGVRSPCSLVVHTWTILNERGTPEPPWRTCRLEKLRLIFSSLLIYPAWYNKLTLLSLPDVSCPLTILMVFISVLHLSPVTNVLACRNRRKGQVNVPPLNTVCFIPTCSQPTSSFTNIWSRPLTVHLDAKGTFAITTGALRHPQTLGQLHFWGVKILSMSTHLTYASHNTKGLHVI